MWRVEEQWDPQRIRSIDAAEQDKNNKKNIHCLAAQCGQYAALVPPGDLLEMENLRVYPDPWIWLCFNKTHKWLVGTLKLEKHWSRPQLRPAILKPHLTKRSSSSKWEGTDSYHCPWWCLYMTNLSVWRVTSVCHNNAPFVFINAQRKNLFRYCYKMDR